MVTVRRAGVVLAVVLPITVLAPPVPVSAQRSFFRSAIELVQVWVTVTTADGRLATGLTRDDFTIYEDGVEQPITHFSDGRVPVSVGMLVDASDSMRGQAMTDARLAVDRFLGELLDPGDQAFVSIFNHAPKLLSGWTLPPSRLSGALAPVRPSGGTAIYDALGAIAPQFDRRVHPRAAVVVISDGADTASDRSLLQTREALRRSDALVYAIAIDAPDALASTRVNPQALREITGPSGGYTEVVRSAADLAPATGRIADELNHKYTLAYALPRAADDSWRSIRVRVRAPELTVRFRRGYFASPR
jgi:VWFA-related protein